MREWVEPQIEELNLTETENGGRPSMNYDSNWFDENGAVHVNFAS